MGRTSATRSYRRGGGLPLQALVPTAEPRYATLPDKSLPLSQTNHCDPPSQVTTGLPDKALPLSHTNHCHSPIQITANLPYNSLPLSHTIHCEPPIQITVVAPIQISARAGGRPLPRGFPGNGSDNGKGYGAGFAWATPLERLVFHQSTWPIVLELTGHKPQLTGGTMIYDDRSRGAQHAHGGFLHGVRDRQLREGIEPCTYCRPRPDGTMACDNFVIFPYFDEVRADDGGVFVLPGSHKSQVVRPGSLFGSLGQDRRAAVEAGEDGGTVAGSEHAWRSWPDGRLPEGCIKPTFFAGDILIRPEATLHGVKPWVAADGRPRRALMLRHGLQHAHGENRGSPEARARMHPLTRELMDYAAQTDIKMVSKMTAQQISECFDRMEVEAAATRRRDIDQRGIACL